jgi:hypothetical protein
MVELTVAKFAREDLLLLDVLFRNDQIVCREPANLFDSAHINIYGPVHTET